MSSTPPGTGRLSRRAVLAAPAAVGLAAAFGDVARARAQLYDAARAEGRLVLYSDHPVPVIQAMIGAFRARYAGITVDFFRGDNSQIIQRFETESAAGRHEMDLLTTTDRRSKQLRKQGLLQPYASPEAAAYPADMRAPEALWNSYSLTLTSFAWNTELVKGADVPRKFQDLLDPRWRGKLGMQDPLQSGGSAIWVVTMYEVMGEAEWTRFMTALAAQRLQFDRYLQMQEKLAAGEVSIQVAAYPNFIEPMKARGAPIEWGVSDPVTYSALTLNLSRHAQRPNAARLFIDFMLSREGQALLSANALLPARADAWPKEYERLRTAKLYPQAQDLETERFDFFQAKMKEFFERR